MRARVAFTPHARARGGLPARIEPVGGCDGKNGHIAAIFGEESGGRDSFRRENPLIGDDDLAIGSGWAQPITAIDDLLRERRIDLACGLFEGTRRQAQVNRTSRFVAQPALLLFLVVSVAALDVV